MIFFLRLESFLFRLEADRQTDKQTETGAKNNMSPHFMGVDITNILRVPFDFDRAKKTCFDQTLWCAVRVRWQNLKR